MGAERVFFGIGNDRVEYLYDRSQLGDGGGAAGRARAARHARREAGDGGRPLSSAAGGLGRVQGAALRRDGEGASAQGAWSRAALQGDVNGGRPGRPASTDGS